MKAITFYLTADKFCGTSYDKIKFTYTLIKEESYRSVRSM
jgi:hypothetical protein